MQMWSHVYRTRMTRIRRLKFLSDHRIPLVIIISKCNFYTQLALFFARTYVEIRIHGTFQRLYSLHDYFLTDIAHHPRAFSRGDHPI